MTEGQQLQLFIDNQTIPKVRIAEALGMSRQNLFQMFKSQFLAPETKKKFEDYFKTTIFTKENFNTQGSFKKQTQIKQVSYNDKDAKIESLQYENIQLRLERIEANLKESLSNQSVMMRQVAVAMHLAAERYAGNDKKKLQEELNRIDKLLASGFE